jgi:hypothetical protein
MNQQGRAFSTASIIFTAGVGSTKGFSAMLADEYILIFLSLPAHIRLTEYKSSTLHNLSFSFFNRLQLSADVTLNTSTAESPNVTCKLYDTLPI